MIFKEDTYYCLASEIRSIKIILINIKTGLKIDKQLSKLATNDSISFSTNTYFYCKLHDDIIIRCVECKGK